MAARALSVVFGLWFALFVGEPEWLSACPMHGATANGAMAAHAGHHVSHGGDDGESAGEQHCSCPGPSCGSGFAALPAWSTRPLATLAATHQALATSALDRVAVTPDHTLPFATAPPTSVRHVTSSPSRSTPPSPLG